MKITAIAAASRAHVVRNRHLYDLSIHAAAACYCAAVQDVPDVVLVIVEYALRRCDAWSDDQQRQQDARMTWYSGEPDAIPAARRAVVDDI